MTELHSLNEKLMTQAYTKYRQQEKHDINLLFVQFCFINIDYRTIWMEYPKHVNDIPVVSI